ncbi:MAG: CoA synthetase [Alphaproteobacteria bacterium]|nr:CoA synthetase [Alphaproteobacteria bacterium]HCP01611.1 CoA synthetase [Rhodospirillaceae bacterium]
MSELVTSAEDLAERIPDGAKVALAPDYSGCSMVTARALISRGAKNLHLIGVPSVGFQGDMLIGAGCVKTLETAAVTLDEYGPAPRFMAAAKAGSINVIDGTCPAIHSGLQAAEKGIPFMPVRGIIGSDLLEHRDDWITSTDPFDEQDGPLVLVKAIRPDIALIHAPLADRNGNIWIGVRREMMLMAHAARETFVTAEEIYDGDLLADEARAPGTIPGLYVSALAEAASGAWPVGLFGRYGPDDAHLREYLERARTDEGFASYLEEFVYTPRAAK